MFKPLELSAPSAGSLEDRKARFLAKFVTEGTPRKAAEEVDESFDTVCKWRAEDDVFRERWAQAAEDVLESRAWDRAMAGDTQLLMFLLKAQNRKKYDDAVARANAEQSKIEVVFHSATEEDTKPREEE